MKKIKKTFAVLLCFLIFATNVHAIVEIDTQNGEEMYNFFDQLMKVTEHNYRFDITRDELLTAAIKKVLTENPDLFDDFAKGAYSALDENSKYLTNEEFTSRIENTNGQFVGIGINVSENNGKFILGEPVPGTPAIESGLQTGDVILAVNDENVTNYALDKVISLIRGEQGTFVKITVSRNGEKRDFSVKRDIIKISPVEYHKMDKNNAGYIKISSFNANTSENFNAALKDLSSQGVDKVILDLRNNLGGFITEAISVASNFVPDDSVVVTESFKDEKKNIYHHALPVDKKFKVVVLVNEYSASASEIVAGAIKDTKSGVLVGKTTFGKGTVQTPTLLKNKDAIWLTIAKYNLPNGENIHGVGIKPDYYVVNRMEEVDTSKFLPVYGERIMQLGDEGKDVLALKQRLKAVGYYFNNLDEKFDDRMVDVVKDFQDKNGLFAYGVADITTQLKLIEAARNAKEEVDYQLEKATELIYDMK